MPFCVICVESGKKTSASFNAVGLTSAKFCVAHKGEGMVNVINKLCAFGQGCLNRPSFNVAGEKPLYCSQHKTEEMINSLEKRCDCKLENGSVCGKVRIFNLFTT